MPKPQEDEALPPFPSALALAYAPTDQSNFSLILTIVPETDGKADHRADLAAESDALPYPPLALAPTGVDVLPCPAFNGGLTA
jgi:hypothetical protein